ncbi:MAG: hypothetical protein PF487_04420 [Bacteroidales bacterium]|nr:hypothetical protein [Bacteroidales bacterium]
MYFFTVFSLNGISKGIACGHAALRYTRLFSADHPEVWDFVDKHETWVILDGGTTNETRDFDGIPAGTMNQIADDLEDNNIQFSFFTESDQNNALNALCFLADERVFNRKDYPDFVEYLIDNYRAGASAQEIVELKMTPYETLIENPHYKEWVRFMGGVKNVFLRELTKYKKLA